MPKLNRIWHELVVCPLLGLSMESLMYSVVADEVRILYKMINIKNLNFFYEIKR